MPNLLASSQPSSSLVTEVMRPIERTARDASIKGGETEFFGKDGFGFEGLLDVVNPLQQLPGISSIYREVSGDSISMVAKLAGGALFGGPVGFFTSLAGSLFEITTGDDIGGHFLSMFDDEPPSAVPAKVAEYYSKVAKLQS